MQCHYNNDINLLIFSTNEATQCLWDPHSVFKMEGWFFYLLRSYLSQFIKLMKTNTYNRAKQCCKYNFSRHYSLFLYLYWYLLSCFGEDVNVKANLRHRRTYRENKCSHGPLSQISWQKGETKKMWLFISAFCEIGFTSTKTCFEVHNKNNCDPV